MVQRLVDEDVEDERKECEEKRQTKFPNFTFTSTETEEDLRRGNAPT
jgi:hypothetical protein